MKPLTERQRFERWYRSRPNPSPLDKSASGRYTWYGADTAWGAWQAAVRSVRARGAA